MSVGTDTGCTDDDDDDTDDDEDDDDDDEKMMSREKNLKYDGLVVLAEVVRKHVGVHQRLSAVTQDVDGFV